jgi:hypothetical protein
MWMLPKAHWGEYENAATVEPLGRADEVARWSGVRTAARACPSGQVLTGGSTQIGVRLDLLGDRMGVGPADEQLIEGAALQLNPDRWLALRHRDCRSSPQTAPRADLPASGDGQARCAQATCCPNSIRLDSYGPYLAQGHLEVAD